MEVCERATENNTKRGTARIVKQPQKVSGRTSKEQKNVRGGGGGSARNKTVKKGGVRYSKVATTLKKAAGKDGSVLKRASGWVTISNKKRGSQTGTGKPH